MVDILDLESFRRQREEAIGESLAAVHERHEAIRKMHRSSEIGLHRLANEKYANLPPEARETYREGLSLYLLNWIITLPAFRQVLQEQSSEKGRSLNATEVKGLLKEMIIDPLS